LAVWKVRAAWMFLDPAYPARRLLDMLADARPALILTAGEVPALATGAEQRREALPPVVRLGSIGADLAALDAANLDLGVTEMDHAYVIFTSGSTGRPKGTVLRHRGMVALWQAMAKGFDIRPGDRVIQFASPSFDAAVFEVITTLGVGGCLVVPTPAQMLPGPGLLGLLREGRINAATMPPSILAALPFEALPALRSLTIAGEACPAELVARWAPGRRFVNAYGPTEVTICATLTVATADGTPPAIGKPIGLTTAYVCDQHLQLVPVGVPGELCLGGPALAVGYLNQPALTAEKFVPDPFAAEEGAAMYRTGDLVRWRKDGQLEFLGRIDHQVKIRGHRIEPDEIQEVIRAHADVSDAAVIVRHDPAKGPSLAGFVVPRDPAGFDIDALRDYLRSRLPAYMLPSLMTIDAMPLTVNGKIDRAALAKIAPQVTASKHQVPPRTPTEKTLAAIWSKVLGVEAIGVHDNFFDLGGASIQTVEVVSLAEQAGITLTPDLLFRHQTIAELGVSCQLSDIRYQPEVAVPVVPEINGKPVVAAEPSPVAKSTAKAGVLVESLGVYLPARSLSTAEIMRGCKAPLDFPLERFTGIRNRRSAGETEFSIDLATKAVTECLSRSRFAPEDFDLLVCCNISRYDGPFFRFSLEPTTAARIKKQFGLVNALAFDLTNACAGTFTALALIDGMMRRGIVRRALVVSGEYITHLTRTAQLEIKDFMDPRMACLTVGDAGVALALEPTADPAVGLQDVELFTLGKYHDLCVARATTESHGGAIMVTEPVKSAVVTTRLAVQHCLEVMKRNDWSPDSLRQLIMHQTSERTLDGAMQEINRVLGKVVVHRGNTVYNLAERGNCATNTHFLAVWENIQAGNIAPGDRVLFAVSGSGLNVGTALYTFDDLPIRLRQPAPRKAATNGHPRRESCQVFRLEKPARIACVSDLAVPASSAAMLTEAGEQCLERWGKPRRSIELILHTGIYHSEFLSEPALATIAAGELGINHDDEEHDKTRTLPFKTLALDLMQGGTGTLTACHVAASLMQPANKRGIERALILASEVENNAEVWSEHLSGIRQTASALLLEASDGADGFIAFGFRAFPEHVDARGSWTVAHGLKPAAFHQTDPRIEDLYVECAVVGVTEFLRGMEMTLDDVAVVLPPARSAAFTAALTRKLGVESSRVASFDAPGGDLFTSSLAYVFGLAREAGHLQAGKVALLIEVGSGIQVVCALYRG
jgi:amino acid adenylation domain-containing protein